MHKCPVCGFDRLEDPPNNYTICPSCGTEFEYDDVRMTVADLRRAWVEGGYKWWSKLDTPPARWNPERQLEELIHSELRATVSKKGVGKRPRPPHSLVP